MTDKKSPKEFAELIIAAEKTNEANNTFLYLDLGRQTLNSLYTHLEKADEFFASTIVWTTLTEMLALHYLHALKNGSKVGPISSPPMPLESFLYAMKETLGERIKSHKNQ